VKVLLAPDSFKGSLTGPQFCAVAGRAIKGLYPGAEVIKLPLSDGGEGLAEVLLAVHGGQRLEALVTDPCGREIRAGFVLLSDQQTAVIDFASASGLALLEPERRDAMTASSLGTGQLIQAAVKAGCSRIVLGLGGSASNDGGVGVLSALGFRFLDARGRPLAAGGAALQGLSVIDASQVPASILDLTIELICDVSAPLLGAYGASQMYAPQKGASADNVHHLEAGLRRLAEVIEAQFPQTEGLVEQPGSGAAGGAGMGLPGLLSARINAGFDYVATVVGLAETLDIRAPDLVITGEGCIDSQTLQGKVVQGVAMASTRAGVPCLVVAGQVKPGAEVLLSQGVSRMIALAVDGVSPGEAIQQARALLDQAISELVLEFFGPAAGP
jgi:glycerate kinase